MIDHEQLHHAAADLIDMGVFEIDEVLKWLGEHEGDTVSRATMIDKVLDIRQTFGRYYAVRDRDEDAREDVE